MLAYPRLIASYAVPAWFILSAAEGSVPDFAVWLPSLLSSPSTSLLPIAIGTNTSGRYSRV
ncbi:MAG: hypothetical protein K0B15_12905 [Lentimicrobium sp.]|nr:hypothetical protein [Lentimicrobium sp.]